MDDFLREATDEVDRDFPTPTLDLPGTPKPRGLRKLVCWAVALIYCATTNDYYLVPVLLLTYVGTAALVDWSTHALRTEVDPDR